MRKITLKRQFIELLLNKQEKCCVQRREKIKSICCCESFQAKVDIKVYLLLILIYISTATIKCAQNYLQFTYYYLPLMQTTQAKAIQKKNATPIPSIYQFYTVSVSNYLELCLQRIQKQLLAIQVSESLAQGQKQLQILKYHKLSNEELKRRGQYMEIVYEFFTVLGQITQQMNEKTYQQLLHAHHFVSLSVWLQKMRLNNEQLSKLTRLKKNVETEANIEQRFHKKLISLLFQTEIFILQILIRVLIIKMIHDEHKKISHLKSRLPFYFQSQTQNEEKHAFVTLQKPMQIILRKRCKEVYKEINKIITYYQLQLSMNRADCRIKPQLECLICLIQNKVEQQLLSEIYKKTELGQLSLQIKQNQKANLFSPFILVPAQPQGFTQPKAQQINEKKDILIKETTNNPFLENNSQQLSIQVEIVSKYQSNNAQSPKEEKPEGNSYLNLNQFQKTAETAKEVKPLSQNSEKSKSKNQRQNVVSSYLKKKTHKGSNSSKLCNYSQYKKLQFISKNQRFGNGCNLQKRLVKNKKQRSQSQQQYQELKNQYNINKARLNQNMQQSLSFHQEDMYILADETPDQRKNHKLPKKQ